MKGFFPVERVRSGIFFVLFYLYLWLEVDLHLIYHGGPGIVEFPSFFKGGEFFRPFLLYPGGLLNYVSAFLSQFFCFSWAGALIVTVQAWLIFFCSGVYLKVAEASRLAAGRFIGPLLLLMLYAAYDYHFTVTMMVLGAMALACAYVKLRSESGVAAVALFVVLHGIAYVLTGGGHLLFAALCTVHELLFRRGWRIALACLASAAVVPCGLGRLMYGIAPGEAFAPLLFAPLILSVYGQFPAIVAKLSLLYLFLPLSAFAGRLRRSRKGAGSAIGRLAGAVFPFVAGAVVVLLFRNGDAKTEMELGYRAYHRKWPEVMEIVEELGKTRRYPNPCVLHTIARALHHTGRLDRDLFLHLEHPEPLLLPEGTFPERYVSWYKFDTMLDLGQVNLAECYLNACAESFGPRPIFLRRLAVVHLAKGDLPTARVYLNALTKTLFDADWALRRLERLKTDPGLLTDTEIQRLRALKPDKDRPFTLAKVDAKLRFSMLEVLLLDLLEKEPGNRMAFDYLMALYLLNKMPERVERNLSCLERFADPGIPRLYQEAVLVNALLAKRRLDAIPIRIDADVRGGVEGYLRALGLFRRDGDRRHLDSFVGSYPYYYFSGASP